MRRAAAVVAVAVLTLLAGCGNDAPSGPPQVVVHVGSQTVNLRPTQYCLDGKGERYQVQPPIIEVPPDTPVALTVPDAVAERGWSVQVFDDKLQQQIGSVDAPRGKSEFDGINTSDVVPPAYYLVVVERRGSECSGLSGAWPVGLIRAGEATPSGTASGTATPSSMP